MSIAFLDGDIIAFRAAAGASKHHEYLQSLPGWEEFGDGWHKRLTAAVDAAMALLPARP